MNDLMSTSSHRSQEVQAMAKRVVAKASGKAGARTMMLGARATMAGVVRVLVQRGMAPEMLGVLAKVGTRASKQAGMVVGIMPGVATMAKGQRCGPRSEMT